MTLPKGWHKNQWWALQATGDLQWDRKVECELCEWKGLESEIRPIHECKDLHQRVVPGGIIPAGQCLHPLKSSPVGGCGGLVYLVDIEVAYRTAPGILQKIAEATE